MRDWEQEWHRALYGRAGAFRGRRLRPGHFRTAPQVGDEFAVALLELADRLDHYLGRPDRFQLVDLGAGGGELAAALHRLRPTARYAVTAIDVADRPDDLDEEIDWRSTLPRSDIGLLIANEWLDSVPAPVVIRHRGQVHRILVDRAGTEEPGPVAGESEQVWLRAWWPLIHDGDRAEVGIPRDRAWRTARQSMRTGLALAVDYHHTRGDRPRSGSLTGYRNGRQVPPRPDGTCDITAHVAFDSAAPGAVRLTQAAALGALGLAPSQGLDTVDGLSARGRVAELLDPTGMGGFAWAVEGSGGVDVARVFPDLVPACVS